MLTSAQIELKPFREIAKIGKKFLVQVLGLQDNYKIPVEKTIRDYETCPIDCLLYKLKKNKYHCPDNYYCRETCTKVIREINSYDYYYENQKYGISKRSIPGKLSHCQIKVALYLHFLARKEDGIVPCVSVKEGATYLGMCQKTFKTSIKKLYEESIIDYTQLNADLYNVYLIEYKNYHLTKKEGGTGYLNLTKDAFEEILKIKNVNSFKTELRKLLEFDNNNYDSDTKKEVSFTYKALRRFLPKYIKYKSVISEVIEGTNVSNMFDLIHDKVNMSITFIMKDSYRADLYKEHKKDDYKMTIASIFYDQGIYINQSTIADLVGMSFEYGHKNILSAIKKYIFEYFYKGFKIENIAGFIRSLLEKSIWKDYTEDPSLLQFAP